MLSTNWLILTASRQNGSYYRRWWWLELKDDGFGSVDLWTECFKSGDTLELGYWSGGLWTEGLWPVDTGARPAEMTWCWDGLRPGDTSGLCALESHSSELHARKRRSSQIREFLIRIKLFSFIAARVTPPHFFPTLCNHTALRPASWYFLAAGWYWKAWSLMITFSNTHPSTRECIKNDQPWV